VTEPLSAGERDLLARLQRIAASLPKLQLVADLDELFPLAWGDDEPCSDCGKPTNLTNQWGRVVCRECWTSRSDS
jgi:hypothetical protein